MSSPAVRALLLPYVAQRTEEQEAEWTELRSTLTEAHPNLNEAVERHAMLVALFAWLPRFASPEYARNGTVSNVALDVVSSEEKRGERIPLPEGMSLSHAVDRLAESTSRHFAAWVRSIGLTGEAPWRGREAWWVSGRWREDSNRRGMLWLDASLADYVEANAGDAGRMVAAQIRERSARAWAEWSGAQPVLEGIGVRSDAADVFRLWFPAWKALEPLAWALWHHEVRPRLQLETVKPAAIPLALLSATMRGHLATGRSIGDDGRTARVTDDKGRVVGEIVQPPNAPMVPAALLRGSGLRATETLAAQRLFRWIPRRAWERMELEKARDPRLLTVVGGLQGLAHELGIGSSKKATTTLRNALDWFQFLHVPVEGTTYHGLLTWEEDCAESRGQQRSINIIPGTLLMPRGGRGKLVPVPSRLPPFTARKPDWPAEANLQLRVLVELRQNAVDLIEAGGVLIDSSQWQRMADEVGLRRAVLAELLDCWLQGGGRQAPPFLRRVDGDRWTLAPAYGTELAMLKEGGAIDQGASQRGKRSARRRRGG